ncbi:MAG: histone deacetylase, partial [bacterium]
MFTTGYVLDPRYRAHGVPPDHPERPQRIDALLDLMKRYSREGLVKIEPRRAAVEDLGRNHDGWYIEKVKSTAGMDHFAFDPDTYASSRSWDTALLAAGGLLELCDRIMAGDIDNGFAFVRPPGHHAESNRAMGFCLFNNV